MARQALFYFLKTWVCWPLQAFPSCRPWRAEGVLSWVHRFFCRKSAASKQPYLTGRVLVVRKIASTDTAPAAAPSILFRRYTARIFLDALSPIGLSLEGQHGDVVELGRAAHKPADILFDVPQELLRRPILSAV